MKKGVRAPDIPRVLRETYDSGIWTHGFFILGFPGETAVEALQTIDLLLDGIDHLDSLVFHDFALPSHLAEYVNFAGRVAMDDPSPLPGGEFKPDRDVAAVRPWLQTFLAAFLEFAHTHGFLHWQRLGAAETRGMLDLYRHRWRESVTFGRARAALLVARALLAELHAQSQRAVGETLPKPRDEMAEVVAAALQTNEDTRRSMAADIAARWPPGNGEINSANVLEFLRQSLRPRAGAACPPLPPHEQFVPQGFR
jgi:hypothetical protein